MLSRRLVLGVVAALFALTVSGGALQIAAERSPGPAFTWGPAEEMPPPLDDMRVLDAIDFAVDEDSISARLLGQPSMLIFVDDATQRELPDGSNLFSVEKARRLLEEAGVTSLTLTIAADPAFPEAAALADAIAMELRSNIGAQVTLVEGAAGLLVTETAPSPTPAPTLAPGTVAFEHVCTPDTFRPDEWVVIECVARSTNQSQDTLSDINWSVGGIYDGSIPDYFFVWSKRDGEFQRVGIGDLTYGGYDLRPGQTVETRTVLLLRMSEGTFETQADLWVGAREVLKKPIRFVAEQGAAAPPTQLVVTEGPAYEMGSGEAVLAVTYETKIMNKGSSPVTELKVTGRYTEGVVLGDAKPAPVSRNDEGQIVSWDLVSFGKESLAPGESLVLRTTYGPASDFGCGWVSSGVVVEATVDGVERRYGARVEEEAFVGECNYEGMPGGQGGGGGPVALGRGGEGPAAAEGDVLWAAFVLAGGGVALVAAAMALLRRSRRRERGG